MIYELMGRHERRGLWAGCLMDESTEIVGKKVIVLRAEWRADLRT